MKNNISHRRFLPPPPLFTIRPPPKPPGILFENFQFVEILNGRCVQSSLDILSTSKTIQKSYSSINWLNIFLLILAILSVICCIIIIIFIFICLKKLKKEEKQYKDYIISSSLSLKHRQQINEHYKCTSNCCDDYYSHQLIPMTNVSIHHIIKPTDLPQSSSSIENNLIDDQDISQNHQYESIPEYLLTMTRHRSIPSSSIICQHSHQLYHQTNDTCNLPYTNFSRLYLTPKEIPTTNMNICSSSISTKIIPEEPSIPLLSKESHRRIESSSSKSMIIGWTKRNSSSNNKQKSTEQRRNFLSHLRKSSLL